MERFKLMRYLLRCKCSCGSKTRSGSSRDDDTIFPGVCCLSTAFSRNRAAGHLPLSTPDYQVAPVFCDLLQELPQRWTFQRALRLSSQRVSHSIGQLNQIAAVRRTQPCVEPRFWMDCPVATLHLRFKSFLSLVSLNFVVTPQISQSISSEEPGQHLQRDALVIERLARWRPAFSGDDQSANFHSCRLTHLQQFQPLFRFLHFVAMKFSALRHTEFLPQLATRFTPCLGIAQGDYAKDEGSVKLSRLTRPVTSGIKRFHPRNFSLCVQ